MGVVLADPTKLDQELTRRGLDIQRLGELSGVGHSTITEARHGRPIRQRTMSRIVHALLTQPVVEDSEEIL